VEAHSVRRDRSPQNDLPVIIALLCYHAKRLRFHIELSEERCTSMSGRLRKLKGKLQAHQDVLEAVAKKIDVLRKNASKKSKKSKKSKR
jgi:hypothetical protein